MVDAPATRAWRYTAVDRGGRKVTDIVQAADSGAATRALANSGLIPLEIKEEAVQAKSGADRELKLSERVLVLRQLSIMIEAGVGLLEAIQTVVGGVDSDRGKAQLSALAAALLRGERFASALEAHAPGFPPYVYAMSRVGESTGRIAEVLRDASEQMAYEDRLRREFVNALTYPAFLLTAGFIAVMFIFTQVVPRFATMIGDKRTTMPLMSRLVLDIGLWCNSHIVLLLLALAAAAFGVVTGAASPRARRAAYALGLGTPLVGQLLRAREIMSWARLNSFSLANGMLQLDAAALSREAAPDGPFRRGLEKAERDLKAGVAIDVALARHTRLKGMDLSLLRAGQKSGSMARMFGFLADGYDLQLRDLMKRFTALVEPVAIGGISILVGFIALSLVLALSSVYETIN